MRSLGQRLPGYRHDREASSPFRCDLCSPMAPLIRREVAPISRACATRAVTDRPCSDDYSPRRLQRASVLGHICTMSQDLFAGRGFNSRKAHDLWG